MAIEVFSIARKGSVSYIFGKPSSRPFQEHMTCPLSMAIERGEKGREGGIENFGCHKVW
jgi:hypothetical protein